MTPSSPPFFAVSESSESSWASLESPLFQPLKRPFRFRPGLCLLLDGCVPVDLEKDVTDLDRLENDKIFLVIFVVFFQIVFRDRYPDENNLEEVFPGEIIVDDIAHLLPDVRFPVEAVLFRPLGNSFFREQVLNQVNLLFRVILQPLPDLFRLDADKSVQVGFPQDEVAHLAHDRVDLFARHAGYGQCPE